MTAFCECCGAEAPLVPLTLSPDDVSFVCLKCMDPDVPEEDAETDEDPDFSCGVCGGSGGGPEHWACPRCDGSGTNKTARKAYLDDRRGDEEYDRWKDERKDY